MRILFLITELGGGGAEKLLNDLLFFIKQNYTCEILIISDKDQKYFDSIGKNGIPITIVPKELKNPIKKIRFIKYFIANGNYSLIHVNLFPMLYYGAIIKKLYFKQIPFIYTEHNTDNRRRHIPGLWVIEKYFIYKQYQHIISISAKTQESLLAWLKKKTEKYSVISNGVPLQDFYIAKPCIRSELIETYNSGDILLCMIGSFTEQKNHIFAMEILKMLPSYFKLILVGEGILLETIKKYAEEHKLCGRVFFLGFRNDIGSIMKSSDMVIIPSKWEGFGLIAVEAMACGIPIICSDVPGLSEVVSDVAIKIKQGDLLHFAKSIQKVAYMSPDERKWWSEKEKQRARIFDIKRK